MSGNSALYDAVVFGDLATAVSATQSALDQGISPQTLLDESLVPAMDEVGRRFECNDFFVPELLLAARAMQGCMDLLNPKLKEMGVEKVGRVVLGTVQGDLHDIGKNLVGSMLTGGGFEVIDLGVDVPPEKFVEKAREKEGTIIALSALLTTTMPQMKRIIDLLNSEGIRHQFKVIIGGAPVTHDYAREIGADGYSENASAAVTLARQIAA